MPHRPRGHAGRKRAVTKGHASYDSFCTACPEETNPGRQTAAGGCRGLGRGARGDTGAGRGLLGGARVPFGGDDNVQEPDSEGVRPCEMYQMFLNYMLGSTQMVSFMLYVL